MRSLVVLLGCLHPWHPWKEKGPYSIWGLQMAVSTLVYSLVVNSRSIEPTESDKQSTVYRGGATASFGQQQALKQGSIGFARTI